MKGRIILAVAGMVSILAVSGSNAAVTTSFPSLAAEHPVAHTNWVENTVTNLTEVRMSRNRFINEYRTNWVEHATTNVFYVYRTNDLTRSLTNKVIVNAWRTNSVDVFHTNWQHVTITNEIALNKVRTNVVDAYHTNFVDAFATNLQTLVLTNWQAVVVMKTNWVTQFVTNAVQLDLPRRVSVIQAVPEKQVGPAAAHTSVVSGGTKDPVIDVSRTTKPTAKGLVEVKLKIRWPAGKVDAPPVQQWRIEREDGAFLSFGQEQEFRKELPVGSYIVQARLQHDANSPFFLLKGTLTVTIKEAVVRPRTDRTKVAAISDIQP